jgi:hypothetical protein
MMAPVEMGRVVRQIRCSEEMQETTLRVAEREPGVELVSQIVGRQQAGPMRASS